MIESIVTLLASILWLASGIGVLVAIVFVALIPLYEQWKFHKYNIDVESSIYLTISEAVERAEGRQLDVVITEVVGVEDVQD